jgi:hypothetical protein
MDWFDGFQEFFVIVYGPLVFIGIAGLVVSSICVAIILLVKSAFFDA